MLNKILFLMMAAWSCFGTAYYIDFTSGSDANNGTAKETPWKYCPGMNGATGESEAHVWASGDTFIFRGGVTWDSSAFMFTVDPGHQYSGGGYTFTVDSTWYTGSTFTRPVFNIMEKPLDPVIKIWYKNDISFSHFEIKNMKGPTGTGTTFGCYDINRGTFTEGFSDLQNWYLQEPLEFWRCI